MEGLASTSPRIAGWLEVRRHAEVRAAAEHGGLRKLIPAAAIAAARMLGLEGRMRSEAASLTIDERLVPSTSLPPAFHGYKILFLADLHLTNDPAIPGRIRHAVRALSEQKAPDLILIGGDFTGDRREDWPAAAALAKEAFDGIAAKDGMLAVLGNHDDGAIVAELERTTGIRFLVDQRARIARGGDTITLVGTEDPSFFSRSDTLQAAGRTERGFSILLAHSPDLADLAHAAGHNLYLCGHTHGGQICPPSGRPILTACSAPAQRSKGWWSAGGMQGLTTNGVGTSGATLRWNSPPQIHAITLQAIRHDREAHP
jgi:predicted MPP superfamily phosphohydrolase